MARTNETTATGWSDTAGSKTGIAIGAALAGIAIGIVGSLGRKIAVQTAAASAGSWDAMLMAEHRAVSELFDQLQQTNHDQTTKRAALVKKIKRALIKHAVQEENIIYPVLIPSEAAGEKNDPYSDHANIKRWLNSLEHSDMSTPGFMSQVAALRKLIDEHVAEEEDNLFPMLKAAKSDAENHRLTRELWREGLKLA
jgi:hemerythrin superfamily protein